MKRQNQSANTLVFLCCAVLSLCCRRARPSCEREASSEDQEENSVATHIEARRKRRFEPQSVDPMATELPTKVHILIARPQKPLARVLVFVNLH